ncbi:MAG: hypothetical protein KGL44_10775 [Sphingomonadales bacterium]|nr:hypothetical protein [Sphingomonadales bacterium]
MTPLALAALLAAQSVPAATTDRIEALQPKAGSDGTFCNAGADWCAALVAAKDEPPALQLSGQGSERTIPLAAEAPRGDFDDSSSTVWPMRIVLGGGAGTIIGVLDEQRSMYSGGGASASQLTLYLVPPEGTARAVATLPWQGSSLIRACFSEADYRQRAGACHDEYSFAASLSIAPGGAPGAPVLRYRTRATSFPGHVSRQADSLEGRPLRRRDLVHVVDPQCSVTRLLRRDPVSGTWEPDKPLPDCTDYTAP